MVIQRSKYCIHIQYTLNKTLKTKQNKDTGTRYLIHAMVSIENVVLKKDQCNNF